MVFFLLNYPCSFLCFGFFLAEVKESPEGTGAGVEKFLAVVLHLCVKETMTECVLTATRPLASIWYSS